MPPQGAVGTPRPTSFPSPLVVSVVSMLLVAACLRPAITSVGPLLQEIQDSTGLSETALGLLGAVPLLAFAVVSPFASALAARWGIERVLGCALVAMAAAVVLRSTAGEAGLWLGTAALGGAVAVGNVLVPAVVKRDFPGHLTTATGGYSTVMGAVAAVASGTAVPLSMAWGGWRPALATWAALPLLVALAWWLRPTGGASRAHVPAPVRLPAARLWRSAGAWQVTVFFGLQSATFYTIIIWLPSIERANGVSAQVGGLHLLAYQVVGTVGGVVATLFMNGRADQRIAAFLVSVPVVVAMLGLAVAPDLALVWVILAATGAGSSLTVSLALVALRTGTAHETAALSGMAQSVGYLLACVGPLSAGLMVEWWESWTPVLVATAGLAGVQVVLSAWAGRLLPVGRPAAAYAESESAGVRR